MRGLPDALPGLGGRIAPDWRQSHERRTIDYLRELNDDDCARLRETSDLWKTWRRIQEHRTLTGHSPSLSGFPPDAITNPN
jgi:hypothetical protein